MTKKLLKLILLSAMLMLSLSMLACGGDKEKSKIEGNLSMHKQKLSTDTDYNTSLFYLNSLEFQVADPSVIYIDEGAEKGYFYAYGTSDDIHVHGFQSWRSKDLTHWESMGIALKPDFANTWASNNYWAPEVIYDKDEKLYYMFYNAESLTDGNSKTKYQYMSVAYSQNPQGPFIIPDNRRNADGEILSATKPVFNFTPNNSKIDSDIVRLQSIDASPFIDPETNKKYMYFSYFDSFSQSEIFGVEMTDWFTPKYETLTQLTAVGYLTVEAGKNKDSSMETEEGTINEGPFMIYEDGTYYMTLSVFGFMDEKYQVRQALSDSPLGVFTKVDVLSGGVVISSASHWDHVTSAGHHSFIKCGDELLIAYHTFLNRTDITDGRALAIDRVVFTEHEGKKLLHTNGPTYSLQALPEAISGYKNLALNAEITANNTASDSSVSLLNDNKIKYQEINVVEEYTANSGNSQIKISFDDYKAVRAIMVYNSYDYDKTFVGIDSIDLTVKSASGADQVVTIKNIEFDWDWNARLSSQFMRPGGSSTVEFNEMPIKDITINIKSVQGSLLSIGEIVVLGSDKDINGISKFQPYSFTNPTFPSPVMKNISTNFGESGGLKTSYGYDLTHDDNSEDAYITQGFCSDQYAYFNNVFSNNFYIEAEFTVIESKAYSLDKYPKFGVVASTPENSIFFYVDAVDFTKQTVGCAQRTLDNRDWDWNATEQLVDIQGLKYTDNNYIKLAMLRQGKNFYLIVNDKIVIEHNKFTVFNNTAKSAVGFLTFNTGMKVKNYSATQDNAIIDQKLAELKPN